jgi:hypothetical protein
MAMFFKNVLFFFITMSMSLSAVQYRICNKTGARIKGTLNYYVLLPGTNCVTGTPFDLYEDESTTITQDNHVAKTLYSTHLFCCASSVEYDGKIGFFKRKDACKDLTIFIKKDEQGKVTMTYKRGIKACA